jgi:hypothetical protein
VVVLDDELVSIAGSPDRRSGSHPLDRSGRDSGVHVTEQALEEPLGPASDWYSLGVVLDEALTACPRSTGRSTPS